VAQKAFISLGSNINPEAHLPTAARALGILGQVLGFSKVYRNPAVGGQAQPDFLNAAALVDTGLDALEVRRTLRDIEASLGRERTDDRYAPRVIDLDLCLYGATVLNTPDFRLPDPDILTRACLAVPLAELYPGFLHPVTGDTLACIAHRLRPTTSLTERPDVVLST